MVGVLLLENEDFAVATAGVNTLAPLIKENIVAIPNRGELLNDRAVVRVEDEQACRCAGYDEKAVIWLIERQWEIGKGVVSFPGGDDTVLLSINDGDLSRVGQVYVNPRAALLDLE